MRLNPANPDGLDRDTLKIIEQLEGEGFTFKAIAQDAILRASGKTPEMYSRAGGGGGITLADVQVLLERFAAEILQEVRRKGGGRVSADADDDHDDGSVSPFAAKFAKSFLDRQRQTVGDE